MPLVIIEVVQNLFDEPLIRFIDHETAADADLRTSRRNANAHCAAVPTLEVSGQDLTDDSACSCDLSSLPGSLVVNVTARMRSGVTNRRAGSDAMRVRDLCFTRPCREDQNRATGMPNGGRLHVVEDFRFEEHL